MLWIPVAPSSTLFGDGEQEEEAPTSYAEHPLSRPSQGVRRVMRFALGIFISALIASGSAVAWRAYSDPTTPIAGPRSGPMSPAALASGPVENSQKTAEIAATLPADKDAIAQLGAAQQTETQQLSEQLTQLHNQLAGLQAEVAAIRELQTSQQAELRRLSGALAQSAAQLKSQVARLTQPRDGD
jgi:hypothetical protein